MTRRKTPVVATSISTGEVKKFASIAEARDVGGFCAATIYLNLRGVVPSHAGFKFTTTAKLSPTRNPELAGKVRALRAKGVSYAKIGKALGIAESTAYYHARSNVCA